MRPASSSEPTETAPLPLAAEVGEPALSDRRPLTPRWPSVEIFDDEPEADAARAASAEPAPPVETKQKVVVVEETITQVEEHRLKRKVTELAARVKELVEMASSKDEISELWREVQAKPPVAGIEPRERTSHLSEATPLVLASDWHIEEEVRPEQVADRNRYNLEISKRRMARFFEAVRWTINHQRQVFKVRDTVMWLGGDIITNYLHDDNIETNLLAPVEAVAYAHASISDGIRFLLQDDDLERLVIPCNDGNHGRLTDKIHSASRIENSIEWLLYYQLQREFRDEPRVQFILPTSSFTFFEVYGRTIRFTHGDRFNYSGGIGGITIPLMRALARWETVRRASLTCMGHWHQRICLPDVMVNASLIGFNSFAMDIGARFEAPSQSLRMLEPRRFCSTDVPLWVSEREDDQG